jgi:hypothetical protein
LRFLVFTAQGIKESIGLAIPANELLIEEILILVVPEPTYGTAPFEFQSNSLGIAGARPIASNFSNSLNPLSINSKTGVLKRFSRKVMRRAPLFWTLWREGALSNH